MRAQIAGLPRTVLATFTLPMLALYMLVAGGLSASAATSLVHTQAPRFVRTDLNHKRLDLHALRGKVVLLNFWATWCAPCKIEMPRFVALQEKYGSRGLQVIGISMDDDPTLVRKVDAELKLNYPVAMGDEKLGSLYGGTLGLPVTFLIDAHGRIQAEYEGEPDLDQIEMQVKSLLPRR